MYGTSARILGTHYVAIQKWKLQNSNFQMGLTVKCKNSTKIFNKNVFNKSKTILIELQNPSFALSIYFTKLPHSDIRESPDENHQPCLCSITSCVLFFSKTFMADQGP